MVKPGYKQTEIGVFPEDWELIYFRNCFEILPNNTLSRAALNYDEGKVKNIHYGDILVKYRSLLNCLKDSIPFITNPRPHTTSKPLVDGDIIIADTAEDETVGKAVEITGTGNQLIVPGLHTIPCRAKDPSMFATGWLGFFLNSSIYHDQLLPLITGTKVSAISKMSISDTVILIPPFFEQRNVAEALSDMDELIASLEKLIAKKKAIKQGAMQELLTGKRRLPGYSREWCEMPIGKWGDLLKETVNPQLFPAELFWEYSMPAYDEGAQPVKQVGKNMHSNRTRIKGTVLLFNKLNVRQKRIWYVDNCSSNAVCSSEFLAYCSEKIDLRLVKYILETDTVTSDFVGMSTGTSNSQKRITPDCFLEYNIKIPIDINEQNAIADILENMEKECSVLVDKLEKAHQIKHGMMQQLLTGKVRL